MRRTPIQALKRMLQWAVACCLCSIALTMADLTSITFLPAWFYAYLLVDFSLKQQPEDTAFPLTWKRLIAGIINPNTFSRMINVNARRRQLKQNSKFANMPHESS